MQGTTARCASLRLKLCEGTMDHWHSPVCTSLLQQRSTVIHNPSRQSDESRIDSTACGKKMLEWWVAITGTTVMHSLPSLAFICWVCFNNTVAWCWLLVFSECFSWSFDCNTVLHLHPVAIPHPGELPAKQPCRRSHQAWQMRHHKDASHLRIQLKKNIFLHETYWKLLKYHEIRRGRWKFRRKLIQKSQFLPHSSGRTIFRSFLICSGVDLCDAVQLQNI